MQIPFTDQIDLNLLKEGEIPHSISKDFQNKPRLNLIIDTNKIANIPQIHLLGESEPKTNTKKTPTRKNLHASPQKLSNGLIQIRFNNQGKIVAFQFNNEEYAYPDFLETSVTFGKVKRNQIFTASSEQIEVIKDGSDGFSAEIIVKSRFQLADQGYITARKKLTLFAHLPYLFVDVQVEFPSMSGKETSDRGIYSVETTFDKRWLEVSPCEIRPRIHGSDVPLRIWKHNYQGKLSYFDANFKEIDPNNADIDCLVSNITDGWMALSNRQKGLLVGYKGIEAANFAFTPLKIRDKGFDQKSSFKQNGRSTYGKQEIRINPFGSYFGKGLHYWSEGNGRGQEVAVEFGGTYNSTAPTFSGKQVTFSLVLSPYQGDSPPKQLQAMANHYNLPPLFLQYMKMGPNQDPQLYVNYSEFEEYKDQMIQEYGVDIHLDKSYLEWVEFINQGEEPTIVHRNELNLNPILMLKLFFDAIRAKLF